MHIKYDVYWEDENGNTRITHGVITDGDLQNIIEHKEREECGGVEDWSFDYASIEELNL